MVLQINYSIWCGCCSYISLHIADIITNVQRRWRWDSYSSRNVAGITAKLRGMFPVLELNLTMCFWHDIWTTWGVLVLPLNFRRVAGIRAERDDILPVLRLIFAKYFRCYSYIWRFVVGMTAGLPVVQLIFMRCCRIRDELVDMLPV